MQQGWSEKVPTVVLRDGGGNTQTSARRASLNPQKWLNSSRARGSGGRRESSSEK